MEILPICRVLEILFMDVCWSYDMYTLVMYDSAANVEIFL